MSNPQINLMDRELIAILTRRLRADMAYKPGRARFLPTNFRNAIIEYVNRTQEDEDGVDCAPGLPSGFSEIV